MRRSLLIAGLLSIGAALPVTAMAEEAAPAGAAATPDWTFPASISFVSDYIFRGQSQTWGRPAAQFSIEADHKSGFYAGFAASNVSDEWLPGANLETDFFGGYRGTVSVFGFDVGGIYYYYPGANWDESQFAGYDRSNSLNTFEIYGSLSYKFLSFKAGRTLTEYFGWDQNNSPADGHYKGPLGNGTAGLFGFAGDPNAGMTGNSNGSYFYEFNATYEVLPTWTLSGQLGRQVVAESKGLDITYFKAGVTKAFNGGWSVGAFYSGTNEPDAYKDFISLRHGNGESDVARDTGFLTISKSF